MLNPNFSKIFEIEIDNKEQQLRKKFVNCEVEKFIDGKGIAVMSR